MGRSKWMEDGGGRREEGGWRMEDGGWSKGDIDEEMMLLRILFQNLCSQFINLNVAILLNLLSIWMVAVRVVRGEECWD